jgi:hypothetical protein
MKLFASNALAGKFFLFLLATCFWASGLAAAEIKVVRASAEYRDERQFARISEFFTGRENTGSDVILRSQPGEREGYYWTIKLKRFPYREEVENAVRLEVVVPGDIEATLFSFPLGPAKRRNPLLLIGLTGDDWPDPTALPLAWRISFLNAEGNLVAQAKSFLWSIE